jgi:hypothetical protein
VWAFLRSTLDALVMLHGPQRAKRTVNAHMLAARDNLQILNSIIQSIAIAVMDVFSLFQGPDFSRGNENMLKNPVLRTKPDKLVIMTPITLDSFMTVMSFIRSKAVSALLCVSSRLAFAKVSFARFPAFTKLSHI